MPSKVSDASKAHWLSAWLTLFTSMGTLLCCALPSLFVVLGMGATLVGLLGQFPALIWLSEHKAWLFGISIAMLVVTFFIRQRAKNLPCPIEARESCERTRRMSAVIYWVAVGINLFGVFFTFVLPKFLYGSE
jgi:FtsH-binding integral membrane protein